MNVESRLGLFSKEKTAKVAAATLIASAPLAILVAAKEISLRNKQKEKQRLEKQEYQKAVRLARESNNSGDSSFIFSEET